MKISVQYSTVIVSDLEKSEAFYSELLGFERAYHVDLPAARITIMQSQGGACVELIESPQFPAGLYSIGTDVDDLGEVLEALKKKGCGPASPIFPTTVGRHAFITDPDGVRICLIEHSDGYKQKWMHGHTGS